MTLNNTPTIGASLLTDGLEAIAYVLFLETWLNNDEGLTELNDELLRSLRDKWQNEWLPQRNAEHCGDCTKFQATCMRCTLDGLFADAWQIFGYNA